MLAAVQNLPFFERTMNTVRSSFEDPLAVFLCGIGIIVLFFWYFATDVERRKRNVGTFLTIAVCLLCILAATPFKDKLKGGIDIVGGSSFSLKLQPSEEGGVITKEQVEKAIEIIEKRLDSMGTAEPLIARQGDDGILVQMPGVEPKESENIRATLEKVAKLELHKVSEKSSLPGPDGTSTYAQLVWDRKHIEPGTKAYMMKGKDEDGKEYSHPILLERRAALGGKDISSAHPSMQQSDAVDITLNGPGTDKMIELTKNMNRGQDRIAIVLDGEVISAPVVNQTPLGKQFIVEGLRDPGEPQNLANALMNPLENPMRVDEFRNISPALGASVVKSALAAGLLSLLFTFLFVFLYYRFSGLVAIIGLLVNTVMLFGIMAMFGFRFSLPGIAGMILTIGMAVDANVLIYERLREEIEHGKSIRHAIDAAYDRAFSAIFDSHVTSLLTALLLFTLGSGMLKGFAITLTVGIVSSLFACILVTRVIFRWCLDFNLIKKLSFLHLIKSHNVDFMGKRRIAFTIAAITFFASIAVVAIKGSKAFGVDFTGGTLVTFLVPENSGVNQEMIDRSLETVSLSKEAIPQFQSSPVGGKTLILRCATEDSEKLISHLHETIPAFAQKDSEGKYTVVPSKEVVSPIIGGSVLTKSLIAIALGLVGIMLYMTMRFEFAFAFGGIVAIFHDVVICVGFIVLMGDQLALIHVGAVLTIAGYSIADTIIVYDRIREMLLTHTGSVEKIMNEAVNSTLSRTILTSSATLVSVITLWIMCASSLSSFGLIITVGIVVGTFSSIYIASPVVLWWSGRKKGRDLRSDVLATKAAQEAQAAAP